MVTIAFHVIARIFEFFLSRPLKRVPWFCGKRGGVESGDLEII